MLLDCLDGSLGSELLLDSWDGGFAVLLLFGEAFGSLALGGAASIISSIGSSMLKITVPAGLILSTFIP